MMLDLYLVPACCSSAIHSHNPLLLPLLPADKRVCVSVCVFVHGSEVRRHILSAEGHTFDASLSCHSASEQHFCTTTGRRQNADTSGETIKTSESAETCEVSCLSVKCSCCCSACSWPPAVAFFPSHLISRSVTW